MSFSADDEKWMRVALEEAEKARIHEDVPIGAIAVLNDTIIGRGHNHREADRDPTAHAEMIAIRQAGKYYRTLAFRRCDNILHA